MNKTVIELAREAEFPAANYPALVSDGEWKALERFAALVIANHPPQSYMTWQEGYEAGKQAEREACAKVCEGFDFRFQDDSAGSLQDAAAAIRARSNT